MIPRVVATNAQYPRLRAITRAGAAENTRVGCAFALCVGGAGHVIADRTDASFVELGGVVVAPQAASAVAAHATANALSACRRFDTDVRCFGIGNPVYAAVMTRQYCSYARRHSPACR